ncbi:unnamed protein product [Microthlaspi erraticum]|uniref:Uncharacterized protein n=1 Tax=Microthlaspi erraticum TaxID=1685480 RepID=A0A6D2KFU2_9BRAS|nr:unnamed protein product [Microthlaspi erraticum]
MDEAPKGRGVRGRGARGRGGRARGRGGRGRGRGIPADSRESVASSMATASVTQLVSVASEASVDAIVGLGAGASPGGGGAPAPDRDDLVVGLLTQLLARFPPVVPQGPPGVPPVAGDAESGFTKLLDLCKCTDRGSMGIEHKDWLLSTLCNYGFWIKLKQKYD